MKKFIFLFFLVLFSLNGIAQDDGFYGPKEPTTSNSKKEQRHKKLERWSFGGNFWLSFGSSAFVELSPIALYQVTPRFTLGPGFKYIYYKYDYMDRGMSVYGPRVIASYTLFSNLNEKLNLNIGNIVLQTEYEYLNVEEIDYQYYLTGRNIWINNLLIGGGIFQPFGRRGGISIMVLYNFIENSNSAYTYSNPVFRLGFYF